MSDAGGFDIRKRPERDFADRWGVFALERAAWLDVHFATIAEAEAAIAVLQKAEARRPPRSLTY